MLDSTVHAQLAAILPPSALLVTPEETKPYECDGLTLYRAQPAAVLLPENEAQVVAILTACYAARVPVVARGAGTSLSGGALPDPAGVVLSLAKFKRILVIDPIARTAVVQPGVRNLAISEAAAAYGLYYAPDPSSQIACSIGGNVAENAGGVHCLKYGLTLHNLRRVRAVLITGEIVELGGESLDSPGYDLLALITGSEGLLAVITEITVKLLPKPLLAQCALAAFDDVEKAGAAVGAIIGAGIIPAGMEMMDQPAVRAVEQFVHANYPLDAAALLLVESDGTHEEVAAEMAEIRRLLTQAGATEIRVSRDEAQRNLFWSGRKAASRRSGASRLTTIASTARFRAGRFRRFSARSRPGRRNSDSRARTSSMRATATCIRSSCSTPTRRARSPKRSRSATASSSFASKSAAR
jgi:glycolate oxidase